MNLETRVRAVEKHLAKNEHGETWQERVDRFKQLAAQGIRAKPLCGEEDMRAIAAGQWDSVTSHLLLASKHRERWERAAPVILQMLNHHEYAENAD